MHLYAVRNLGAREEAARRVLPELGQRVRVDTEQMLRGQRGSPGRQLSARLARERQPVAAACARLPTACGAPCKHAQRALVTIHSVHPPTGDLSPQETTHSLHIGYQAVGCTRLWQNSCVCAELMGSCRCLVRGCLSSSTCACGVPAQVRRRDEPGRGAEPGLPGGLVEKLPAAQEHHRHLRAQCAPFPTIHSTPEHQVQDLTRQQSRVREALL